MSHLMFMYYAYAQASSDVEIKWNPEAPTVNPFAIRFPTEGYYLLLKRMVETKIVDSVTVIIESIREPGKIEYAPGITGYVIPSMRYIKPYVKSNTVIWCRGGFRSWVPFFEEQSKDNKWLLCYAANTGREKWSFWNIIFNDTGGTTFVDGLGRQFIDFRKPIVPDIFRPISIKHFYDFCVGASNIHDKKGQWRIINIVKYLQNKYAIPLKFVIPGAIRKGTQTNKMMQTLASDKSLLYNMPGMLPRQELAVLMNQCGIFLHLGTGGQGDRGVLEAMSCGVPVVIGAARYHSPLTYSNPNVSLLLSDLNDVERSAEEIYKFFLGVIVSPDFKRAEMKAHFEKECGIDSVIVPRMAKLFSLFRYCPKVAKEKLYKHVIESEL